MSNGNVDEFDEDDDATGNSKVEEVDYDHQYPIDFKDRRQSLLVLAGRGVELVPDEDELFYTCLTIGAMLGLVK